MREDPEVDAARACIEPKQIATARQKAANLSDQIDMVHSRLTAVPHCASARKTRFSANGALFQWDFRRLNRLGAASTRQITGEQPDLLP
jgi:hypothetical protein